MHCSIEIRCLECIACKFGFQKFPRRSFGHIVGRMHVPESDRDIGEICTLIVARRNDISQKALNVKGLSVVVRGWLRLNPWGSVV